MITIYTTPSCSSCRKAKKWLKEHNIDYVEKNLFNTKFTKNDLIEILEKTDFGFDDIISTRSKVFKENDLSVDKLTINELIKFIQENPSILKRPIIIDDKRLQIGYNDEEIETFLPRIKDYCVCDECRNCDGTVSEFCEYDETLKSVLKTN